jgi:hypothetical protein
LFLFKSMVGGWSSWSVWSKCPTEATASKVKPSPPEYDLPFHHHPMLHTCTCNITRPVLFLFKSMVGGPLGLSGVNVLLKQLPVKWTRQCHAIPLQTRHQTRLLLTKPLQIGQTMREHQKQHIATEAGCVITRHHHMGALSVEENCTRSRCVLRSASLSSSTNVVKISDFVKPRTSADDIVCTHFLKTKVWMGKYLKKSWSCKQFEQCLQIAAKYVVRFR